MTSESLSEWDDLAELSSNVTNKKREIELVGDNTGKKLVIWHYFACFLYLGWPFFYFVLMFTWPLLWMFAMPVFIFLVVIIATSYFFTIERHLQPWVSN